MQRPPLFWLDFYLPLPFDTGLHNRLFKRAELDPDRQNRGKIPGWEDVTIDPSSSGLPEFSEPGVWPCSLFAFRQLQVREPASMLAAIQAFPEDLIKSESRLARWLAQIRMGRQERISRTVVRLCRLDSPPTAPPSEDWIKDQFETCLGHLNEVMVAIAVSQDEAPAVPVHPSELGPRIPSFQTEVGRRLQGLHAERIPIVLELRPRHTEPAVMSPEDSERLVNLLPDPSFRRPFLPLLGFLVGSRAALRRGQPAQAVVDANTAIEVLVSRVIAEVGPIKDPSRYDEQKVRNLLDAAGFKGRLVDHFAPILGLGIDLDDVSTPIGRWWIDCYQLRNRIVHRGYRPSDREGWHAFDGAVGLIEATGRELAEDPTVPDLGTGWHIGT